MEGLLGKILESQMDSMLDALFAQKLGAITGTLCGYLKDQGIEEIKTDNIPIYIAAIGRAISAVNNDKIHNAKEFAIFMDEALIDVAKKKKEFDEEFEKENNN